MTSSLSGLSLSFMCSHPIHHHRRGKMLVLTVPRMSVWFRSPQVSLGHCDVLTEGALLDGHPPLFFRPPSRPTSTVTFSGECFLTQVAKFRSPLSSIAIYHLELISLFPWLPPIADLELPEGRDHILLLSGYPVSLQGIEQAP